MTRVIRNPDPRDLSATHAEERGVVFVFLPLPHSRPDPSKLRSDGAYLRSLRLETGATQADFAATLGCGERTLRAWETRGGYDYGSQWLAECLARRHRADRLRDEVERRGGDRRAVLFAQTLYLSGRCSFPAAATRALSWAAALASSLGADHE